MLKLIGQLTLDTQTSSYLTQKTPILEELNWVLINAHCELKTHALWIVSNLACNSMQDLEFIRHSSILSAVCLCAQFPVLRVQMEAFQVIAGVLAQSVDVQWVFARYEILVIITQTIKSQKDNKLTLLALHALKSCLEKGGEPIKQQFEISGGLDVLEDLQKNCCK